MDSHLSQLRVKVMVPKPRDRYGVGRFEALPCQGELALRRQRQAQSVVVALIPEFGRPMQFDHDVVGVLT